MEEILATLFKLIIHYSGVIGKLIGVFAGICICILIVIAIVKVCYRVVKESFVTVKHSYQHGEHPIPEVIIKLIVLIPLVFLMVGILYAQLSYLVNS